MTLAVTVISTDAFVYWYPVGVEADELGGGNIIPVGDPNVRYGHKRLLS